MISKELIHMNVALNLFAFVIVSIIFFSCLMERANTKKRFPYFTVLMGTLAILLIADTLGWIGETRSSFCLLTLISDNISACAGQIVIFFFLGYLKEALFPTSVVAGFLLKTVRVLCLIFVVLVFGVLVSGLYLHVDNPEYHQTATMTGMGWIYLIIPVISVLSVFGMVLFASKATKGNRIALVFYLIFPVIGVVIDYYFYATSFTYLGLVVSAVTIYTQIYLRKQKLIESQRNALMLSQINPHFTYNTLSTIAAMCDISPKTAKTLTIDFSRYLRQNLDTLSSDELIPFDKELEHIECYLKIEKARFGSRVNVIYSVQCKDFSVPPLSVQPLVENAVKHGITKRARGGTLKISTWGDEYNHIIEVKDDGVGFDTENKQSDDRVHVGIKNVESRLREMCKGNITIKSTPGVGTRVTIEIPKQKKGKAGRDEQTGSR